MTDWPDGTTGAAIQRVNIAALRLFVVALYRPLLRPLLRYLTRKLPA